MKQPLAHRVLLFIIPIALLVYNALSHLYLLLTTKIAYQQVLAVLSFFTLSCGLINLIGREPFTIHLILVGLAGLILSVASPLMQAIKLGIYLLYFSVKKEKAS